LDAKFYCSKFADITLPCSYGKFRGGGGGGVVGAMLHQPKVGLG